MPEVNKNELLIQALLDGELSPSEARKARAMLSADPSLSDRYEQYRRQKKELEQLPRFSLPDGFADRVLAACDATPAHEASAPPNRQTVPRKFSRWHIAATALASSAATLLLSLMIFSGNPNHSQNVALKGLSSPETGHLFDDVEADAEATEIAPMMAANLEAIEIPAAPMPIPMPLSSSALLADIQDSAIEQVWLIETQNESSGQQLLQTLAANSIQLPSINAFATADKDAMSDDQIDGILIEATSRQMRKTLIELAASPKFAISAFPLPGHEAYFADVQHSQRQTERLASQSVVPERERQPSIADVMDIAQADSASDTIAAASPVPMPPQALAQTLKGRQFKRRMKQSRVDSMAIASNQYRSAGKPTARDSGLASRRSFGAPNPIVASTPASEADLDALAGLFPNAKKSAGAAADTSAVRSKEKANSAAKPVAERQSLRELFPQRKLEEDQRANYLLLIRTPPKAQSALEVQPQTADPR